MINNSVEIPDANLRGETQLNLEIMSWNIAGILSKKSDQDFCNFIRNFDIIAFQETWTDREIALEGYEEFRVNALGLKQGRKSGGISLLIKANLNLPALQIPTVNKSMLVVKISLKKQKLLIFNIYFPPKQKCSDYHLEDLLQEIGEIRMIHQEAEILIMGDLNARLSIALLDRVISEEEDEAFEIQPSAILNQKASSHGTILANFMSYKLLRQLNGRFNDCPARATFDNGRFFSIIDLILMEVKSWPKIVNFEVIPRVESDHNPLHLSWTSTKENKYRRKKTIVSNKADDISSPQKNEGLREDIELRNKKSIRAYDELEEVFQTLIKTPYIIQLVKKLKEAEAPEEVFMLYESLNQKILDELGKSNKKLNTKKNEKYLNFRSWFDEDCLIKKRELNKLVKEIVHTKREDSLKIKSQLVLAKAEYKKLILTKKKAMQLERWQELNRTVIEKDSRQFWRLVAKGYKDFHYVEDSKIPAHRWESHFAILFQNPTEDQDVTNGNFQTWNKSYQEVDQQLRVDSGTFLKIDEDIMRDFLCTVKSNKAAGPDGMTSNLIKADTDWWLEILVKLGNTIGKYYAVPDSWKKSIIMPIFKKGERMDTMCYRPISLLDTIQKIYGKWILWHLTDWSNKARIIPDFQVGFCKAKSTMNHCITLSHLLEKYVVLKKGYLFAIFIDLAQAFDSINRNLLWRKLDNFGIEKGLLKILQIMHTENTAKVKVGPFGEQTNSIKIQRGVRQGCSLSPMLFNLYIADFPSNIDSINTDPPKIGPLPVPVLLYADDTVLMGRTRLGLQKRIDITADYLVSNQLKMNISKTKIIEFGNYKKKNKFVWRVGSKKIDIVQNYKYLGLTFNYRATWTQHKKELKERLQSSVGGLLRFHYKYGGQQVKKCIQVYDAKITSAFKYGSEIWGGGNNTTLQVVENKIMRTILGVANGTPAGYLRIELGRPAISDILRLAPLVQYLKDLREEKDDFIVLRRLEKLKADKMYPSTKYVESCLNEMDIDTRLTICSLENDLLQKLAIKAYAKEFSFKRDQKIIKAKGEKKIFSLIYSELTLEPILNNYLEEISQPTLRKLFTKARFGQLPLGELRSGWKSTQSLPKYCNCKNRGIDSLMHLFFVCNHVVHLRRRMIRPLCLFYKLNSPRQALCFFLAGEKMDVTYRIVAFIRLALKCRGLGS